METCKTEAVTKEAAEKAKKLLQRYERQEKAKKKAKLVLFACSAAVYKYLKEMNGEKDRDEWSEKDRKFYNNILARERKAMKAAAKCQIDMFERATGYKRHRWNVAMDNALMQGDIKFLEACGVTRAAMEIRRSRLMKNQPKKETANA